LLSGVVAVQLADCCRGCSLRSITIDRRPLPSNASRIDGGSGSGNATLECGEGELLQFNESAVGGGSGNQDLRLACSYWDTKAAPPRWSTEGCHTVGVEDVDGDPQGKAKVHCACSHLTGKRLACLLALPASAHHLSVAVSAEFVILLREAEAEDDSRRARCAPRPHIFGSPMYLAFAALYGLLAASAASQFARVIRAAGCSHWLMATEHALVLVLALTRGFNM
jgi:hypothetical protein